MRTRPRPLQALVLAGVSALALRAIAANEEELGDPGRCERYSGVPAGWPEDPDAGMVQIEGGEFVPGSSHGYLDERPGRSARVGAFLIDRTEVTNAQFEAFVRATGYVTVAERRGSAPVFRPTPETEHPNQAWANVEGASWRHPEGPESDISERASHPVVQIAYEDALAYAEWLGHTLPTEAQWEFAARGGRTDATLHRIPKDATGRPTANFWQGDFPRSNDAEDGYVATAPVGCYWPNEYGLHDMVGNVWEWTRDPYRGSHADAPPRGWSRIASNAPRVIKGGSFLCSTHHCARYRVTARHRQEIDMMGFHLGFRTVRALD